MQTKKTLAERVEDLERKVNKTDPPSPFKDEKFMGQAVYFGTIEDRKKFDSMASRYGFLQNGQNLADVIVGSPMTLAPYGTDSGETGEIRLQELAVYGTDYVGLKAPDSLEGSHVWTMPETEGEPCQFLQTDGEHRLSWGWPYWIKTGDDIYYDSGHVSINDVPHTSYQFYVKGRTAIRTTAGGAVFSTTADPYIGLFTESPTARIHYISPGAKDPDVLFEVTGQTEIFQMGFKNLDSQFNIVYEPTYDTGRGFWGVVNSVDDIVFFAIRDLDVDTRIVYFPFLDSSDDTLATGGANNAIAIGDNYVWPTTIFGSHILIGGDVYSNVGSATGSGLCVSSQDSNNIISRSFFGPQWVLNDTSGDYNCTYGIVLQQGASDDQICSFKSSDIAHGMTVMAETDTWYHSKKYSSTQGGGRWTGLTEGTVANCLYAYYTTDITTKSSAGLAPILLRGALKSSTTVGSPGANANLVAIQANTTTVWIADADGDTWQSGNLTGTYFVSNVAVGTAPFQPTSTTVCTNLNADLLDGYHSTSFLGLPDLTDPGADRIVFWDETDNALKWLACGNSIAITGTTLDAIQDIRTTASPTFAGGTINFESATGTGDENAFVINVDHNKTTAGQYDVVRGIYVYAENPSDNSSNTDNSIYAVHGMAVNNSTASINSLVGGVFSAASVKNAGSVWGIWGLYGGASQYDGSTTSLRGLNFTVTSGSLSAGAVVTTGMSGSVVDLTAIATGAAATVTIDSMTGYRVIWAAIETTSGEVSITNAYGIYVEDIADTGTPTITNQYGLYIAEQTVGATKYGIYVAGGDSYLGGNLDLAVSKNYKINGTQIALNNLGDVATGAVVDGNVLTYNTVAGKWIGAAPAGGAAHNLLSATHSDSTAGAAVQGDVIYADATPKWTKLAANAAATQKYLTEISGSVPSWREIVQADVNGLKTTDSPTFAGLTLSNAGRNLKTGWIFDDFLSWDTDRDTTHFVKTNSGTGAYVGATSMAGQNLRPGIAQFQTGTTTTGYAALLLDNVSLGNFQFGAGVYTYETDIRLEDLSDGTETYTIYIGFIDKNTTLPTDGAYFKYTDVGGGSATPNWYMSCSAASTRTETDTGTAVAADTWIRLKIVVNADASSVEFFINGVSAGTVTTNIPTAYTDAGMIIIKSAGTTNRKMYSDWVWIHYDLTTTR